MDKKYNNYMEFVKDSRKFNNSLIIDRRLRSPFIDTQTGVAQTDCSLWRSNIDRHYVLNQKGCNNGTLYSYPAPRWQKRRREYLLKFPSPPPAFAIDQSCQNSTSTLQQAVSTIGQAQMLSYQQQQQYNFRSHQTQFSSLLAPSRADSTGSHSCLTMDSDSHDHSIATSQSFDSPKHQQLEEELLNGTNNYELLTKGRLVDDETISTSVNHHFTKAGEQQDNICCANEKQIYSELTTSQQQNKKNHHLQLNQLDRTKEAIRLHSRMSKKKKNIGQSLMKTNSILVKTDSSSRTNTSPQHIYSANHDQQKTVIRENQAVVESSKSNIAQAINSNGDRPYFCSICDRTYKTRPGLRYHFIHTHNTNLPKNQSVKSTTSNSKKDHSENSNNNKSRKKDGSTLIKEQSTSVRLTRSQLSGSGDPVSPTAFQYSSQNGFSAINSNLELENGDQLTPINSPPTTHCNGSHQILLECRERVADDLNDPVIKVSNGILNEGKQNGNCLDAKTRKSGELLKKSHSKNNPFCDFCLGTADRNRRTKLPEKLISCTACGSSGHPTCLRFSENIKLSIQKYDWQCIECKTCSTCNNADNEDQLLFCDDCDRSYHTYCLSPPLVELPEGNWSCSICLVEYHGKPEE